jgi:cysteinyl-tRNA synthetase
MARRLVGSPVDIHGGGPDLIYPHHESELAQAECAHPGEPFVRHWMHSGEVRMGGTKMSKSLGNLAFVRDLVERHEPETIRRLLLSHHYREDWDFVEDDLAAARASVADPGSGPADRAAFVDALDDDLDTPAALAVLDRAAASGASWVADGRAILGLVF